MFCYDAAKLRLSLLHVQIERGREVTNDQKASACQPGQLTPYPKSSGCGPGTAELGEYGPLEGFRMTLGINCRAKPGV